MMMDPAAMAAVAASEMAVPGAAASATCLRAWPVPWAAVTA